MANTSVVRGLIPKRCISGGSLDGKVGLYLIPSSDATATFIGDLVKLAGSADSKTGRATIAQAAAGSSTDIHVGVVVGFDPTLGIADGSENLRRKHRPASTAMYALVIDSPDVIFEVQEDAVGGALAVTDVGLNADIIVGSGDTSTGFSGMQLDTSTKATTATLPLKIVGIVDRADNEIGSANQKVEVLINSHRAKSGTVGL
jgi:hypothetical protein